VRVELARPPKARQVEGDDVVARGELRDEMSPDPRSFIPEPVDQDHARRFAYPGLQEIGLTAEDRLRNEALSVAGGLAG
jgi:hypothetical protein